MGYFRPEEFACRCGNSSCPAPPPDPWLIRRLEVLRARVGSPIIVTSGSRCEDQNARAGGKAGSAHLTGTAADLGARDSLFRWRLLEGIFRSDPEPLFTRVGIGPNFIHVDVSPHHAQKVVWGYY